MPPHLIEQTRAHAQHPAGRALARATALSGAVGAALAALVAAIGFSPAGIAGSLLLGACVGALIAVAPPALRSVVQRDEMAARIHDLEQRDPLTGLPNDKGLAPWLQTHLEAATEAQRRTGLLIVHAERFEKINQTHGRAMGDEVVHAMVARIKSGLSPEDRLFRTGGMNFVIIRPDADVNGPPAELAARVIETLNTPYEIDHELIRAPAVAGVAVSDTRAQVAADLLRDAEVAAYRAADIGDGAIIQFEQSLMDHLTPATAEFRLRQALERGEFHLAYQPTLSVSDGAVIGAEALLRWTDEDRGLVHADEFLPAMEETGIIVPVGNWVLSEACRQSTYWSRTYPAHPPIDVVVNISLRQLLQSDFVDILQQSITDAEADPRRLVLEITEAGIFEDREASWAVLRACKDLGVRISLDEFGAGLSSISALRTLNLDQVKIHRSVTESLVASTDDAAVVRHLCALCSDLRIVTVAEGVENRKQVDLLRSLGCQAVQGYAIGEPMSPGQIDERLYEDLRQVASLHPPATDATTPPAPTTAAAPVGATTQSAPVTASTPPVPTTPAPPAPAAPPPAAPAPAAPAPAAPAPAPATPAPATPAPATPAPATAPPAPPTTPAPAQPAPAAPAPTPTPPAPASPAPASPAPASPSPAPAAPFLIPTGARATTNAAVGAPEEATDPADGERGADTQALKVVPSVAGGRRFPRRRDMLR